MSAINTRRRPARTAAPLQRGFTLVELLVVLTVIAVLAVLGLGAVSASMRKSRASQCISKMRGLGGALLLYAADHDGELPRSMHSAASYREDSWTYAIAPYLEIPAPVSKTAWPANFERLYRCPEDRNTSVTRWSYALNVFYELNPDGDDYDGSPQTWRRIVSVPHPARTVLLAEPHSTDFGDHIMCHLWKSDAAARNALDYKRHGTTANYLFLDGHVDALPVDAVFSPANNNNNLFNPSLAK